MQDLPLCEIGRSSIESPFQPCVRHVPSYLNIHEAALGRIAPFSLFIVLWVATQPRSPPDNVAVCSFLSDLVFRGSCGQILPFSDWTHAGTRVGSIVKSVTISRVLNTHDPGIYRANRFAFGSIFVQSRKGWTMSTWGQVKCILTSSQIMLLTTAVYKIL